MNIGLKLFFCIMSVGIGAYAGYIKSEQYKNRVRQLNDCELFLSRLKTYMSASRLSTGELFQALAQTDSLNRLVFVKAAASRLKEEPNFPLVFRECIEKSKPKLALKDEDYIPLLSLCELLGSYDTSEVINGIELSAELVRQSNNMADTACKTNGKLARSLGLLFGIAAAILII